MMLKEMNKTLPTDDFFSVKWTPPIDGFNQFVQHYRNIIDCPLGGSRLCRHQYTDVTISKVLSVGVSDNRSSLPQRISLSNFKIGTPITSYGGILRYKPEIEEPQYLLIKRPDSESYIDLVRGNYRESQLFFMIQYLPLIERERLLSNSYETLWFDLHSKPSEGEIFEFGKEAFMKIAPHLKELFEKVPSIDPYGKFLFGFPKGRPQWCDISNDISYNIEGQLSPKFARTLAPESPFSTALREFIEETNGIEVKEIDIVFSEPIIERYLGSNSKEYSSVFYVFQTDTMHEPQQFPRVDTPIRSISTDEIDLIKWVPLSELDQYLRTSRIELINFIENNIPLVNPTEVNSIWKCPSEMNDFVMEGSY
jgi:hypothetical protein